MSGLDPVQAFINSKRGGAAPATSAPPSGGGDPVQAFISSRTGVQTPENPFISSAKQVGRGIGSGLGTMANALDLPMAAAENVISGRGLGQIPQDLTEGYAKGGWRGALSSVAENDVYFRKGSLDRVVADPSATPDQKRQAQWFLDHPTHAGVADFVTEFANPSNLLFGGVARLGSAVGRATGLGAKMAQGVDEFQALARDYLPFADRFAGMRVAGRATGMDPQHAENLARGLVTKGALAEKIGYDRAYELLGNMTNDQQKGIIHIMQGNDAAAKLDQYLPSVQSEMRRRAKELGKELWMVTREQLQQGTINVGQIFGRDQMFTGAFDNIKRFASDTEGTGLHDHEAEEIAQRARTGDRPEFEPIKFDETHLGTPQEIADRRADVDLRNRNGKLINDQLNERADKLAEYFKADHPPSEIVSYFPMARAFKWSGLTDEYEAYEAHHNGSGFGKNAIRKGSIVQHRQYQDLLDAETNAKAGLRADWSPARSLENFLSQRYKNVMFDQSMEELVNTPLVKMGERPEGFGMVKDIQGSRMFGSARWREAAAHEHVINFFEEFGATKGEASAWANATGILGKAASQVGPFWRTSQEMLRQGVVANPIVHGGWNLMGQYLASGGDIRYLPFIVRGMLGKRDVLSQSEQALMNEAKQFYAISERGAPRSISQGSAMDLAARPRSDLNPLEKARRVGADVEEWNKHVVFDLAEPRYAAALYATFRNGGPYGVARKMNQFEAGNMVRRALGDYGNVANAGMDKKLQSIFFFYPWLKTVLPFWVKTGVVKPQTWAAPYAGIQTQNELAGDPNFGTGTTAPYTLYTGTQKGRPQYFSVPLVQRILGEAADIPEGMMTGQAKLFEQGVKKTFLNRLNPATSGLMGAVGGALTGTVQPTGLFGYAPLPAKLQGFVGGLGEYAPGPLKAIADVGQVLFGQRDFDRNVVLGEMMGGTGYSGTTAAQKAVARHIRDRFYGPIDRSLASGDKNTAWKFYLQMQQTLKNAGVDPDPMSRNPERADETNPLVSSAGQGMRPLEATTEREPGGEAPEGEAGNLFAP